MTGPGSFWSWFRPDVGLRVTWQFVTTRLSLFSVFLHWSWRRRIKTLNRRGRSSDWSRRKTCFKVFRYSQLLTRINKYWLTNDMQPLPLSWPITMHFQCGLGAGLKFTQVYVVLSNVDRMSRQRRRPISCSVAECDISWCCCRGETLQLPFYGISQLTDDMWPASYFQNKSTVWCTE